MNWIQLDRVIFYSCTFLFWSSVWINWFSWNKNSDEKSTLKFNHIRAVWENSHVMRFFQIRNKGIQAYTCRKFKKKIFYLNNARKQTTEMSKHLIKTYSINKTSYFMIQICGRKIVTTAFVYLYIRGFYLYSIFTTHFKKVNAFLIELILKLCV